VALAAAGLLIALIATGLGLYPVIHRVRAPGRRRLIAWLIALALLGLGWALARPLPPWGRLVVVWALTFASFKALVLLHTPAETLRGLGWWRYCGFLAGWIGMDVEAWTAARAPVAAAGGRIAGGAAILVGGGVAAALLLGLALPEPWRLAQAWCVWVLGVIAVFFGLTRLLAGFWNWLGRPVRPVFDQPVYARSLADWWGRRWNLAVHDTLTLAVWLPLRGRRSPVWAAGGAVFLLSGLLHELLLSYPAGGGWGGPSVYFAIQAGGMFAERRSGLRRILRAAPWRRAAWTLGVTLIPGPLLFHPPLLLALVAPWLGWAT
jgi:alginate O-acetyltransferase complex protein AlgI